jgi:ribosome-associated heat shock protein Hsp15
MDESGARMRIDKWLWVARFFKTRSLAAQAVQSKVRLNGASVKPAKELRVGDELVIRSGDLEWTVVVQALAERRGPAPIAQALYTERTSSAAQREAALAARRERSEPAYSLHGRPTKRDRRLIRRFTAER